MGMEKIAPTALVFPPLWDTLDVPPLGPAVLAGALRLAGLPSVLFDLNLDFYAWLVCDETLRDLVEVAAAKGATVEQAQIEQLLKMPSGARAAMPEREAAVFALATSLGMVARPLLGPQRYLAGIHSSQAHLAELVQATPEGQVASFWQQWMERHAVLVAHSQPTLVAITISHLGQLLPAVSLAHQLRRQLPHAALIAGGPYCTSMLSSRVDLSPLFAAFDGIGAGPGDEVLVRAAQSAPELPAGLAGLWVAGGTRPALGKPAPASPDFSTLSLQRYYVGDRAPLMPLETSRGCWARCRYCNYRQLNRGYSVKPMEQVVTEVADVQARVPDAPISFVDDTLAPKRALALAEAIAQLTKQLERTILWEGCLRADAGLDAEQCRVLRAGGMQRVFIGFDAATEGLLQEIDKRATLDQLRLLVGNLQAAGITVSGNFIVGLPGETEADRRAILGLVGELKLDPKQVTTSLFGLVRGSWYFTHLDEMGWPADWVARVKANDLLTDFLPTPPLDPKLRRTPPPQKGRRSRLGVLRDELD